MWGRLLPDTRSSIRRAHVGAAKNLSLSDVIDTVTVHQPRPIKAAHRLEIGRLMRKRLPLVGIAVQGSPTDL